MIRNILIHSYVQLIKDNKLVALSLSTMFAHSFIFVLIILYNLYFYLENEFNLGTSNEVIAYVLELLRFENVGIKLVVIGVFLFFGYFVLAPIGEGALVWHIHHNHKSFSKAISAGTKTFFAITKYEAMTFAFNIVIFLNMLSKVFLYDLNNWLVMSAMIIRLLLVLGSTLLLQFTKTIIVVEGLSVMDAIKKSIYMSLENVGLSIKLVGISLLFNIRLIVNVIFIIGLPLAGVVLFHFLGATGEVADVTVYILFFASLLFLAYINTLIEGYFKVFWYLGYISILGDEEKLQHFGLIQASKNQGLFDADSLKNQDAHLSEIGL